MPIQNNPPRQFGTAIQRSQNDQYAVERGAGAFNGITEETITSTNSDGSYGVANTWLTTSGVSQPINVGDIVKVGWHGGKPVVILSHTARRAKFVPPPPVGGPIVEMLLAAPTTTFAVNHSLDTLDIYFRNANQTTLLKCRDKIAAAGFTIALGSLTLVPGAWGLDHRRFLVQFVNQINSHPCIAIFHLTGNSTTPITTAAVCSLLSVIDLAVQNIALGNIQWIQNVAGGHHTSTDIFFGQAISTGYLITVQNLPAPPVIIQTAAAVITNAVLTRNEHLILSISLTVNNQDGSGAGGLTPFYFPYIIDITAGSVLFNGISQQGIWPGNIYNGAVFIAAGPGFFDFTTGSNSVNGGPVLIMIPGSDGNYLRVLAGLFAFNVFNGFTSLFLSVRDLSTIALTQIILFPLTMVGANDNSHFFFLSSNHRYVMWARAAPGGVGRGGLPFAPPFSSTLTYDFKDGVHITDIGTTSARLAISGQDAIVLTSLTSIEAFLNDAPYLTNTALMWEDHNDLRVAVDPNSSVPNSRVAPEFVTFRKQSVGGPIVAAPFVLPLRRLSGIQERVATLRAIPTSKQYIVDMVVAQYTVSGHQDVVVGYSIFNSNGNLMSLQVISGPGSVLPNS